MPSSILSSIKQIILPRIVSSETSREIELRINLGSDDFYQTNPAEVLYLDTKVILKSTLNELEKQLRDENAKPTPARRELQLRDLFKTYKGTLGDGTPVEEDLAALGTTFWNELLTPGRDYQIYWSQIFKRQVASSALAGASSIELSFYGLSGTEITLKRGTPDEQVVQTYPSGSGPYNWNFYDGATLDAPVVANETIDIREFYWQATIDPDSLPKKRRAILNERSATPTPVQVLNLRLTEAADKLSGILVQHIIEGKDDDGNTVPKFERSDMVGLGLEQYPWYGGFAFDSAMENRPYLPVPVPEWRAGVGSLGKWTDWYGPAAMAVYRPYGDTRFDTDAGFSQYGITFGTILSKIAEAANMDFVEGDCTTGFHAWRQLWNGNNGWDASLYCGNFIGRNPFNWLCINFNWYFGLRPDFDCFSSTSSINRYFQGPITVDKRASVIAVLQDVAEQFGCDIVFEYNQRTFKQKLLLYDLRQLSGTAPRNWEIADAGEVLERPIAKTRVTVGNKGDMATLSAPTKLGDAVEYMITWRAKKWGREEGLMSDDAIWDPAQDSSKSSGLWEYINGWLDDIPESGDVKIDGTNGNKRLEITSGSVLFSEDMVGRKICVKNGSHRCYRLIEKFITDHLVDVDEPITDGGVTWTATDARWYPVRGTFNPGGYIGGSLLYCLPDAVTNIAYPPGWANHSGYAFAARNPTNSHGTTPNDDNWKGFYSISHFEYSTDGTLSPGHVSGNSVWGPLQFYTAETVGHKMEEQRTYYGCADANGFISTLRTNMGFSEGGKDYRVSKLGLHEKNNTTRLGLLELDPDFPKLPNPPYPVFPNDESGMMTGGSFTTGSYTGGLGSNGDQTSGTFLRLNPYAGQNVVLPLDENASHQTDIRYPGSTADAYQYFDDDKLTKRIWIAFDGQFYGPGLIITPDDNSKVAFKATRFGSSTADVMQYYDGVTLKAHLDYTGKWWMQFLDAQGFVFHQGGVIHGGLGMDGHVISDLFDPVDPQDAATKNYVDEGDLATLTLAEAYADAAVGAIVIPTDYVKTDPSIDAQATITGGSAAVNTLTLQGVVSQTGKLLRARTNAGDLVLTLSATGNLQLQPSDTSTVPLVIVDSASGVGTADRIRVQDTSGNARFWVASSGAIHAITSGDTSLSLTSTTSIFNAISTATSASSTGIITISNTGSNGRGQFGLNTGGDVRFGPQDNSATLTGAFGISGGFSAAVHTLTVNTALTGLHNVVYADTTAGNRTMTLPDPATCKGHVYRIKKKVAANTLTVATSVGTFIDGAPTKAWTVQYESHDFISDGINWLLF